MTNQAAIFPKTLAGFYRCNFFKYNGAKWMIWAVIMLCNTIAFRSFPPIYTKWFIEILEKYGAITDSLWPEFTMFGVSVILVLITTQITFTIAERLRDNLVPVSTDLVSRDLYSYAYNQTVGFYSHTMPGKIANQITLIAGGFRSTFCDIFGGLLGLTIVFILNMGLIFQIDCRVGAVLFSGIALRVFWVVYRYKPYTKAIQRQSDCQSTLSGKLLDGLSNFVIVKLFAGANKEEISVDPARKQYVDATQKSRFQKRLFFITSYFFDSVFVVGAMFFVAVAFSDGGITIADAAFILAAYMMLNDIVWSLVYAMPDMLDSYNMAAEAYQTLIKPIEIKDAQNAKIMRVIGGAIEIKNLQFSYDKRNVLNNLSLAVRPGEKIGLVGLSGAGKTTLMNLLMRLYDPTAGVILIDGQDLRDVTQESLRENISFIPQDPTMFNRSLRDNIAYGAHNRSMDDIRGAAIRASADEFINETADKYDTLVGDRGIKLSGGQKQRIAIARAFLKNAPILILDEATSALDSETEAAIQKSLSELSIGRTTIAIAHRLSTLRQMDRLIVMDKGQIIESGSHAELVDRPGGIYANLWAMQSGGFIKSV